MARSIVVALLALTTGLAVGCGGEPAALAVGDVGYTEDELGLLTDAQRQRLGVLTAFALVVAADRTDEVVEAHVEREQNLELLERFTLEQAARLTGFDDARLRSAYAANPDFRLTVRHVVILGERWRDEVERAEARAQARTARNRILSGDDFARVAAEMSGEPGAARSGGRLPPATRESWVPEFWDAAAALRVGQVSDVVETRYGYHVLQLLDRDTVPFDRVRHEVLPRLIDLAAAMPEARAWADGERARVRLDAVGIAAFRTGQAPAARTLASWPGGSLTAGEVGRHLMALDAAAVERIGELHEEGYNAFIASLAGNDLLVGRAREAGIELTAAEREAIRSDRVAQVDRLAATFGFSEGSDAAEVKAAALDALAATRQSVRIAEAELRGLEPALRVLHPIRQTSSETPNSAISG